MEIIYKHRKGGTFYARSDGVPQTLEAMTAHAVASVNHPIMEACTIIDERCHIVRVISHAGRVLV